MRLVFYSGGQTDENFRLHQHLFEMTGRSYGKASFTYIPFCSEFKGTYFRRARERYGRFGFGDFFCLPIDCPVDTESLHYALESDVIYLAGGNTFYFLYHLKKQGMLKHLRSFANDGGVLAGLSAGALLLTPNIELAAYPDYDCDENEVGLRQMKALNLVGFEIFPHFVNSGRLCRSLAAYSLTSKHPIHAIPDGNGLVVEGDKKTIYGRVKTFYQGAQYLTF